MEKGLASMSIVKQRGWQLTNSDNAQAKGFNLSEKLRIPLSFFADIRTETLTRSD